MSKTNDYLPITALFKKYMDETAGGKRLQKNGKIVTPSTLKNYNALLVNLVGFQTKGNTEDFLINTNYRYSKRHFIKERNRYRRFYKAFTDYLYQKACTDNYVGMQIKIMRSFFIYLNTVKGYNTGDFYKAFYVRKEEIPIIVLSREQLQMLISNHLFEQTLLPHLQVTKDIFVLGCTVGLRFSDLLALKRNNLQLQDGSTYLITKSQKTGTSTRIKLPGYALQIIGKYHKNNKRLLPALSLNQFNKNLKALAESAGWTYEVGKERSKRGVRKELQIKGKGYRFCDLMSSHMMRRTAITTLLMLGMPEPLVRKISGHAANSKEFYKYVRYSESFLDQETDKAFSKLIPTEMGIINP